MVKLIAAGPIRIAEHVPAAGASTLQFAQAEKFYNYNGQGYEAPKTLYKLRWSLPAGTACLTFHTEGSGSVSLVTNGSSRSVNLAVGVRQLVDVGDDHTLEVTPPEPFLKGTALPLQIRSIDVLPGGCP